MATLHAQISDELRQQISSGALAPGAKLPSEDELTKRYGVSRVPVRQALRNLEQEGLIESRQGRDRIVRTRQNFVYRPQAEFEPRKSQTTDRYITGLVMDGRNPSQTIEIAIAAASGIIASRFGVPDGTPMAVRKRVRAIDGAPFNISDTYYLLEVVNGTAIMEPKDLPQGSNFLVAELMGAPEVRARDEFYIRMPEPEETQRLRLSTGTPVAVHYATGYTADDRVLRVDYHCLPGDRHVIVYNREHPKES